MEVRFVSVFIFYCAFFSCASVVELFLVKSDEFLLTGEKRLVMVFFLFSSGSEDPRTLMVERWENAGDNDKNSTSGEPREINEWKNQRLNQIQQC